MKTIKKTIKKMRGRLAWSSRRGPAYGTYAGLWLTRDVTLPDLFLGLRGSKYHGKKAELWVVVDE